MKAITVISALASICIGVVAAEELKIDVTSPVECTRKTKKGDKVSMHYKGTLGGSGKRAGEKFDASYDRGQPLTFTLGSGQVIAGWDQGLLDMCIGEKRTLTIPPELAYGSRGVGPIPPDSTLVFETKLVAIEGVEQPGESEKKDSGREAGEKVASAVSSATEAVKTIIADTDDVQGHEEL